MRNVVRVRDILIWLDERAPFRFKASWDQCGLQVGDPEAGVGRVLVALDPSSGSISEAERLGCDCLVTHHPLLFSALYSVRLDQFPGNLIAKALCKSIHLIAAHTNLDVARDGTNDQLASLLLLRDVEALDFDRSFQHEGLYGGMGRVGFLPHPVPLETLVERVRETLGIQGARVVGERRKQVHRVALCTGSGGSLVEKAISSGSQVYITGDVKYHDAQRAMEAGLAVIDVGHFASERIVVQPVVEYLRSRAARDKVEIEVLAASEESDPFWIYHGEAIEGS
jgi:dinuclear metal center YbgI/SA1388 family protein